MKRYIFPVHAPVLCLLMLLGTAAAHAEWDVSCSRELLSALTRSYACQRIMNIHAVKTEAPNAMVAKHRSSPLVVSFSSRTADRICGSIDFGSAKVIATTSEAHATAALRLQGAINDAFNRADAAVEQEAIALADVIVSSRASIGSSPSPHTLEGIVTQLDAAIGEAIASHGLDQTVRSSTERCTVSINGITLRPPKVSGPDVSALRQYKAAHPDYEKFLDWLARSVGPAR